MRYLRRINESTEDLLEDMKVYLSNLTDEGFIVECQDHLIRIWKPIDKSDSEYSYENSNDFNWSDVEDEIARTMNIIKEKCDFNYLYTIASRGQDGFGFNRTEWIIDNLITKGTFGYAGPGIIKCVSLCINYRP